MLHHYENQCMPALAALMEADAITYSVLYKILTGVCTDIYTDGEGIVIAYSAPPYPIWVWCREESSRAVAEVCRCLKANFPLEQGYVIILSDSLRQALADLDDGFAGAEEKMGLLSYRLDALAEVPPACDGTMQLVGQEEIEALIPHWIAMRVEMEGKTITEDHARTTMTRMAGEKCLFAWKNDAGETVALCARGDQPPYSKVTSVYTLPEHRRRGYCQNLVYAVTKRMLRDGFIPILYTDADYAASNACYQKIGYRQIGRLTSIRHK